MAIQSKYWRKYFDFTLIDKNRTNGLCKLCKKNYKDLNGIYSNFLKHLKRKHPQEYLKIFPSDDKDSSEDMIGIIGESCNEQSTTKANSNRISVAIAKYLIIKCNMPLNLVENSAFREFLKECHVKWEVMSTKTMKKTILPTFKD